MITVREAIEALQQFDPDTVFVLSSDEEGNNVRMVNGIGEQQVKALEYQFMETVCKEDIDEYDNLDDYREDHGLVVGWQPIEVAEVW